MTELNVQNTLDDIFNRLRSIDEKVTINATHMETLLGSAGRLGRLDKVENDVEDLKTYKNKALGYIGAALLLFEAALHWAFKK